MAEAIVTTVVEKIVELLVAPIVKQFRYLVYYNSNIEKMRRLLKNLEDKKHVVERRVDQACCNNEIIRDGVTTWLKSVDDNKSYVEQVLKEKGEDGEACCNKHSINLKSRYQLSRKSVKKTEELDALLTEGEFERVSDPQQPTGIVPASTGGSTTCDQIAHGESEEVSIAGLVPNSGIASTSTDSNEGLKSRLSILNGVMEAIQNDKIRIIGICGSGGIGKTTLVKEVAKRARDGQLVDEIAMAVVTNEVDMKRIQGDIAEDLGLTLNEQKLTVRASRLRDRLTQKKRGPQDKFKKILIILDDMWSTVNLDEVGILSGYGLNDCKIVLTSRSRGVCDQMNARIFPVDTLDDEEAWSLFQKVAKTSLEDTDRLYLIAKDIVNQCEGLPLAITTNALGLINKSSDEWIRVHLQLVDSKIEGEYAAAKKALMVSFDRLKSKEIKHFFLLCCLFPEDFSIPIEDLVRYGLGLRLFNWMEELEWARCEARDFVHELRNSNLLLEGESGGFVKMHDVVRDFAIWIAEERGHVFMVRFGNGLHEWPMDEKDDKYTSISLQCDEMHKYPDNLNCPNLNMLQLVVRKEFHSLKFPREFFRGMVNLQVLALRNMPIPYFQYLKNLRTLSLYKCKFVYYASMLGYLEKLEILSCVDSDIKELPVEAKKLSQLRLLDLTGCKEFRRIAPGVLPSFVLLKELYMKGTSMCWAEQIHENQDDGETNASFAELKYLSNLVAVEIEIPYEVFPIAGAEPGLFSKEE